MKYKKHLSFVFLALCIGAGSLLAQGFETKFKAVGFKPGDVYHTDEDVQVSLNGGGLEVSIPLGPALPGPIPIRPVAYYHGKYVHGLNSISWPNLPSEIETSPCLEGSDFTGFRRWSPPKRGYGEIHPGYLLFSVGSLHLPGESTITVTSDSGRSSGYFFGMPGTYTYRSDLPSDVSEINSMVAALAPEWIPLGATSPGCTIPPHPLSVEVSNSQSLGPAIGVRLSGETILVFGPSNAQIWANYPMTFMGLDGSVISASTISIPNEILQINDNLITLWRRSRNVYHMRIEPVIVSKGIPLGGGAITGNQESAQWDRSVYHPVWIKNRDGFKVNIEVFRTGADSYYPGLDEGGLLKGYKVSSQDGSSWFQVGGPAGTTPEYPVSFGGMGFAGTSGVTLLYLEEGIRGEGPNDTWQPGTTNGYNNCPLQWDDRSMNFASLGFSANSITYGDQTTSFQWGGPQGLLSGLTTACGKSYIFTYEMQAGIGVDAYASAVLSAPAWDYCQDTPNARNFWTAVTRMDVSDGNQTRSTAYRWRSPQVDVGTTLDYLSANWASRTQGVTQTLPDGQTILHVFAPTVDLPKSSVIAQCSLPISRTVLDQAARTLMAQRQTIVAHYYYAQGDTSWNSFITSGVDPESTNWYKREILEGFDLRSWEAAITRVTSNSEPRSTRMISEERGGPVEVTESYGWDASRNQYANSRTYHLPVGTSAAGQFWAPGLFDGSGSYPSPSGAIDLAITQTTFAPQEAGLFARPQAKVVNQSTAPTSGTAGKISDSSFQYNSAAQAHLLNAATQNATDGSVLKLKTEFTYDDWNTYTRMSTAILSGSWTIGTTGFTYNYDDTGRWLTSIQVQNATYKEQEPKHDWRGNPKKRIDANGIETTYTWDDYGRLTGIDPPSPETPTSVTYDSDFKGAIVTRGNASTHYRYNSFGELISIEKPTGDLKTFAYDLGGRKTFESVWSNPSVGVSSTFDARGRLSQTVSPNGEITDFGYPSPLVQAMTQHPLVRGVATATTTCLERDSLGRLAKVTNANGEVTTYTYDPGGKLTKVVQGAQVRNWIFNGLGWLTSLIQPESGTTTYSNFTISGKPATTNYNFGNRVLSTTYDLLGRATDITAADGSVTQHFEFDGGVPFNGKLRWSSEPGVRLDYSYLGLNGRLDCLTTSLATVMGLAVPPLKQNFVYDNLGNIASATLPSGRTVVYGFDPIRNVPKDVLAQTAIPGMNGPLYYMANVTQFNAADFPEQISFANGASTTLAYGLDQARLASMTHLKTGNNAFRHPWSYVWDGAGQLVGDGEDSFEYDNLARLVKANLKVPNLTFPGYQYFAYDAYGNMISRSSQNIWSNLTDFTFNSSDFAAQNRIPKYTSGGGWTGTDYDTQGNLKQVFKYIGTTGSVLNIAYDALGRVSQVADSSTGITERYGYNPEGLRTRIEIWYGNNLQKVEVRIYNPQHQLVSTYIAKQ